MPISESGPTQPRLVRQDPTAREFPLSVGQERLWWSHQLDSSHDEYHICGGWRFPDGLEPGALSTALADLVRRHEILRSRFVARPDGTTVQEVLDDVEIPVVRAGTDWRAAVHRAASVPFDLARPPVVRAVTAELDDGPGLFLAMHHIVTDRWSMDVLARDLAVLYRAASAGHAPPPPELPELPLRYGDYANWQRQLLIGPQLRSHVDYWRQALAGYERLELPLDRPRPAGSDTVGRNVVVEVTEEATSAMTAMAWRARASQVMVVTAALAATLHACTGQSDIVIGAIVSDRPRPELQDMVGFFINTVILRIDLSTAVTFKDVVVRTRDAWLRANAHKDAPFEMIVGAVNAGSEDGRNPIFDIVINHAGDNLTVTESAGFPDFWNPEIPVTARFDLSVTTTIADGRLRATFLYRPELFDEGPIAALATRYVRLLEHGVVAPDRPLHELNLVDEAERKLLHSYNDPTPAPNATVVELVRRQAAARPAAPAVVGADGILSYQELDERSNQLARHLLTRDVGPERVVAVCLERTVERFVVLLAVVKCGAAYLPLDPAFPIDRMRFLLSDSDAVLTVVSPALRDHVPSPATGTLVYGRDELDLSRYDPGDLPPAARPDNLAYLISTSGSTGVPKAVAVSHRALSRLVAGGPRYLEVGPGAVFLQDGPLTFDVSVLEWTPLAHGGTVVVTDTGTLLENLDEVLRDFRVTTLKLVSPQLDLIVERDIRILSGLRQLVVGGDVVGPRNFRSAVDSLPGCRVMASYGPTESTVLATVYDEDFTGRVPIGRAIPHTSLYVLDQDLESAAVGMRGEIYLAGDGLARGYLNRPGLTAAAFLPNPYGPPGSRMYRTGDVGRYLANGAVDFLGRADRQVKIRGFRIETSEIEHVLLRRPGITSAVVVRAELATGPALVAYLVATDPVDVAAVRAGLLATLPAYLVPDHIIEVPRLPLTANNKVDRSALPPVPKRQPRNAETSEPTNGLAARVAEAWSGLLGGPLSATDDFFEHGGHSLLVPRATAAVRRLLGREIPLRLMMRHRTPDAYAVAALRETAADVDTVVPEYRLAQQTWHGKRVDLFLSAHSAHGGELRTLVVLDGAEFVDIMRLPAVLDRLVAAGRIPRTAAVFLSPTTWSARRSELLDDAVVDMLADELLPHLRAWLGDQWRPGRSIALGASLGGITAIRAALRRQDRFAGAVALSAALTDYPLDPPDGQRPDPSRFFLSAGQEEGAITLDDGASLLDATVRVARRLADQGHTVRRAPADGGHTYAAWEAMLPQALSWALGG